MKRAAEDGRWLPKVKNRMPPRDCSNNDYIIFLEVLVAADAMRRIGSDLIYYTVLVTVELILA